MLSTVGTVPLITVSDQTGELASGPHAQGSAIAALDPVGGGSVGAGPPTHACARTCRGQRQPGRDLPAAGTRGQRRDSGGPRRASGQEPSHHSGVTKRGGGVMEAGDQRTGGCSWLRRQSTAARRRGGQEVGQQ